MLLDSVFLFLTIHTSWEYESLTQNSFQNFRLHPVISLISHVPSIIISRAIVIVSPNLAIPWTPFLCSCHQYLWAYATLKPKALTACLSISHNQFSNHFKHSRVLFVFCFFVSSIEPPLSLFLLTGHLQCLLVLSWACPFIILSLYPTPPMELFWELKICHKPYS